MSGHRPNKITFKRTRSLSNAACFKHDNSVCACTVSALIPLPVVNLSLEMDSATSISYTTWRILPFDAPFCLLRRFFTAHAQFRPYYYFRFKIGRHIWIQRVRFPLKMRSFQARDTIFGDFCDHNVCACAVLINVSPKMDSETSMTWRRHLSRPTLHSPNYGDFSLRMRNFDHITTSG